MLVIADGRRDEIWDLWIDSAVEVQVLYVRETCPGHTLEAQKGTFQSALSISLRGMPNRLNKLGHNTQ